MLAILISIGAFSQDGEVEIPRNKEGQAEYSKVSEAPDLNKDELFVACLEWINKTFKSGKAVIQTTDKEGGMIIGNAITSSLVYNNMGLKKDAGYFSYTISIYCKDKKYKYVVDNIFYKKGEMMLHEGANLADEFPKNWKGVIGDNKQTRREWKSFQRQTNKYFAVILEDLQKHVAASKSKNDW
jgi:hypothetical protein